MAKHSQEGPEHLWGEFHSPKNLRASETFVVPRPILAPSNHTLQMQAVEMLFQEREHPHGDPIPRYYLSAKLMSLEFMCATTPSFVSAPLGVRVGSTRSPRADGGSTFNQSGRR